MELKVSKAEVNLKATKLNSHGSRGVNGGGELFPTLIRIGRYAE